MKTKQKIMIIFCSINNAGLSDIRLYRAVKNFFLLPGQKLQISRTVNILPSIEGFLCTTGFYKLLGLPGRSQIQMNI
jgi:hypothetical protein